MMFKNFNLYNKFLENYSDYTSTEMLVCLTNFTFLLDIIFLLMVIEDNLLTTFLMFSI